MKHWSISFVAAVACTRVTAAYAYLYVLRCYRLAIRRIVRTCKNQGRHHHHLLTLFLKKLSLSLIYARGSMGKWRLRLQRQRRRCVCVWEVEYGAAREVESGEARGRTEERGGEGRGTLKTEIL